MNKRAEYLREHYPHANGFPLERTADAARRLGMHPRTFLRRAKAAGIAPARRAAHGHMLWRHADVARLVDIESQACHSGGGVVRLEPDSAA